MINCNQTVEQYLETLSKGFHCDGSYDQLNIITPYLYPNNALISLHVSDLGDGNVRVSDGGETDSYLFMSGYDLSATPRGRANVQDIALTKDVEYSRGEITKTGPMQELGTIMQDVIQTAIGASHLIYTSPRHRPMGRNIPKQNEAIFRGKVEKFLKDKYLPYKSSVQLRGSSGQDYSVHYRIKDSTLLHILSISRSSSAKSSVDRAYRMWADCSGNFDASLKITLLNDEAFRWQKPHVNLLKSLSTVVPWSERDRIPELVASLT